MATVLVVDNDARTREYVAQLVDILGHQGVAVEGGEQAIAVMMKQRPSLVITEVDLPAMDGFEFLEELRSHPGFANTPVLLYTGRHDEHTLRNAQSFGVVAVLHKSDQPKAVVGAIRKALEAVPGL